MNKNSIEIPLVKATYEELQQVICELQVERYKYKTTIDKIKEYIKEDMYGEPNELYGLVDGEHILKILEEIK